MIIFSSNVSKERPIEVIGTIRSQPKNVRISRQAMTSTQTDRQTDIRTEFFSYQARIKNAYAIQLRIP
jgi:hypothetical protein